VKLARRLWLAALAATVIAALGASSASATVIGTAHGIKYVRQTLTVLGGGTSWGGGIGCGTGFRPLSGGTFSTGFSDARMTSSIFGTNLTSWTSAGWNEGFGKSISTLALCRKTAAAINYVTNKVPIPGGTTAKPAVKTVSASCPANTAIAAGGVQIPGNLSAVHVSGFFPVTAPPAWRATVVNTGANRSVTVGADCVPKGLGLTYDQGLIPNNAADPNGFLGRNSCSTPNSVPIGGGARWSGAPAQAHIATTGPIDGSGNVTSIPDDEWQTAAANDAGAAKDLTLFVICKPA
jgi:hypothetical protein